VASHTAVKAQHATLSAATADTVTLSGSGNTLRIRNRGTAGDIYFTVDGVVPVSLADDTYFCGPGESIVLESGGKVVKLISAGTPEYSVELY
jgi:hypothetical protein